MATIKDLHAAIDKAITASRHAMHTTEAVRAQAADALKATRAATHDSKHREVTTSLNALVEAEREAELVLRRLDASIKAVREYQQDTR